MLDPIQWLNGISYGLLLFMLSAGLTLIFSMMGVLNFAHASFYMLGAYVAYEMSMHVGYWYAIVLAPIMVGGLGAMVERYGLRKVHQHGQIPELLFTFGLAAVMLEVVQLIWGRAAVPYVVPPELDGSLLTLFGSPLPKYRAFMMIVSLIMIVAMSLALARTRLGLIVQAALTHPQMLEALGHNVPQVHMWVFGGGCALAALAGAIGGSALVTEPGMAAAVGSIIFVVVVVGGMGSLTGALCASLLIGLLQTMAVTLDYSLLDVWRVLSAHDAKTAAHPPSGALWSLTIAQCAPIMPYLLLVLVLIVRPRGLLGRREA